MLVAAALVRTERLLDAVRIRGAISHLVWPRSVWIDTAYMVGPLLARAARETGRGDLSAEAVRQVQAHMDLLEDGRGTYLHMLCPSLPRLGDPVAWARGNGWLLAGAAEVIEILGPDRCEPIVQRTVGLAATMAERQLPSGLWPALLDRPGSPPETSAAALAAIGIHALDGLGLLDARIAKAGRRAALAVLDACDARGWIRGSQGPVIWARPVPAAGRWPWTQGLALMMAARYLGQGYTLRQEGKRCLEGRSPPS
jgi:unsaturated rhamnogalacturonyl hydrolase